jgi:hypothetical protein
VFERLPGLFVDSPVAIGSDIYQLPLLINGADFTAGSGIAHLAGQIAFITQVYVPVNGLSIGHCGKCITHGTLLITAIKCLLSEDHSFEVFSYASTFVPVRFFLVTVSTAIDGFTAQYGLALGLHGLAVVPLTHSEIFYVELCRICVWLFALTTAHAKTAIPIDMRIRPRNATKYSLIGHVTL